MNKIKLALLAMILIVGLSGCFEILEEVNLNKDGSGSVSYTFNMSQSKVKIQQVMKLDSINGYPVPSREEISDSIAAYMYQAQQLDGISNLSKTENYDDMIFGFSCDFENLQALNDMASSMNRGNPNDPNINRDHYQFDAQTKIYNRSGDYNIKKEFEKLRSVDQAVFENAKFVSIFRSEVEILNASNPSARLAPSNKAVMVKLPILDIIKEKNNLANSITLNQ